MFEALSLFMLPRRSRDQNFRKEMPPEPPQSNVHQLDVRSFVYAANTRVCRRSFSAFQFSVFFFLVFSTRFHLQAVTPYLFYHNAHVHSDRIFAQTAVYMTSNNPAWEVREHLAQVTERRSGTETTLANTALPSLPTSLLSPRP